MEIIDTMKHAAITAGKAVMREYEQEQDIEYKADESPVTKADKESHAILLEHLSACDSINVLSEEDLSLYDHTQGEHFIIDPIDGTKDFIKKTGDFCIMVAYAKEGKIDQSVIYEPVTQTLYWAVRGQGAYKEHEGKTTRLQVSAQEPPRMLVSRYHRANVEEEIAQTLSASFIPHGSAGLKLARIAEGAAEIYLGPMPLGDRRSGEWDSAAGVLLVEEAGGSITDYYGTPLVFQKQTPKNEHGFVASNGHYQDQLITLTAPYL